MMTLQEQITELAADVPEAERAAYVDRLMTQAGDYLKALDAEEKARAAHTMIGLEQALRGEGYTMEESHAHMEEFLAELRQQYS